MLPGTSDLLNPAGCIRQLGEHTMRETQSFRLRVAEDRRIGASRRLVCWVFAGNIRSGKEQANGIGSFWEI